MKIPIRAAQNKHAAAGRQFDMPALGVRGNFCDFQGSAEQKRF